MVDQKQITAVAEGLLIRAPAKINLSLLIAGKRPDGFHEIETIMAKVNFYDDLLIEKGRKKGVELTCKGSCWAPEGKDNLVCRAAELLLKNCRSTADLHLTLTKNIPAGSGLGSASSDAAATLIGLNNFLNLPLSTKKLRELAADLGSDVAFFLHGPLAFCTGRGEKVKNLKKNFKFLAILILPDISVSTKTVYNDYMHNNDVYRTLASRINDLLKKNNIDFIAKMCTNMLLINCLRLYGELADLKNKIESLGLRPLCLSGSGAAMFYIVPESDREQADKYRQKLDKIGCKSVLVSNNRW